MNGSSSLASFDDSDKEAKLAHKYGSAAFASMSLTRSKSVWWGLALKTSVCVEAEAQQHELRRAWNQNNSHHRAIQAQIDWAAVFMIILDIEYNKTASSGHVKTSMRCKERVVFAGRDAPDQNCLELHEQASMSSHRMSQIHLRVSKRQHSVCLMFDRLGRSGTKLKASRMR